MITIMTIANTYSVLSHETVQNWLTQGYQSSVLFHHRRVVPEPFQSGDCVFSSWWDAWSEPNDPDQWIRDHLNLKDAYDAATL